MLGSIYCKLPPDPICLLFCEREIHAFHEIEEDSQSDKALFLYQEIRKEIISSELKEALVKILDKEKFKIDFDKNKIQEIKEKIENKLRDKGLLPSSETIPTLAQNASLSSISPAFDL
jgi:chromosome condensin MukBEF MukE localization factor